MLMKKWKVCEFQNNKGVSIFRIYHRLSWLPFWSPLKYFNGWGYVVDEFSTIEEATKVIEDKRKAEQDYIDSIYNKRIKCTEVKF